MSRVAPIVTMVLLLLPMLSAMGDSPSYLKIEDSYWSGFLVPGMVNTFTVELKSLYPGSIREISSTLTIHDMAGSDYSGNFSYTGSLFEGQVLVMDFRVFVPANADASHYRATLEVNFTADDTPETEAFDLYVTIHGTPQVRCSLSATAKPGRPAKAQLTLSNYGDGVARRVRAVIRPASPNVQVSSPVEAGIINPGENKEFPVTIYVGDSADEAVTLTVTVTWESQVGAGGQYTCVQNVVISEVPPRGLFLTTNTTTLEPGKVNKIYLFIENRGGDAFRTTLTVQSPPNTAVRGSNKVDIGNITSGNSVCVPIDLFVDPTVRGPLQLLATVDWFDSGSEHRMNTATLGFYVETTSGPYLVAYTDRKVLTPGSQDTVDIILRNEGEEMARSIRVSFVPSKDLALLSPSGVDIGDLEPGQGVEITVLISSPNVSYGSLVMTLQISYLDEHDRPREQIIPLSFITESPKAPLISVSPLDTELMVDEVSSIRVKVVNEGGLARNLVVKLALPSPELGAIVGEDYTYIEQLDPGESVIREFSVYLSPQAYGAVQFLVHASYEDEAGILHSDLLSFGVRAVGKPQIEVAHVSTVPSSVYPGDTNVKLIAVLTNVGNYVAKDFRIILKPIPGVMEPSSPGTDAFLIPALPPNQAVDVTFLIDIEESARPGRYEAILVSKLGNTTIPIQIDEKARFKLLELSIPGKPKPGERGVKLTVVIKNEARVTAKDVVLEVITPYLVGTTSLALGEVPPRSKASAIMEVDIDENAPERVPMDIKISWKQDGRSLYQTIHTELELEAVRGVWWGEGYLGLIALSIVAVGALITIPLVRRFISGGS
ncbi:MAG: hypothetical protein QI197_08530 [Candidatus Korarchaeota archaeon]|nr:hypothetical protein [Candidatus Korarchaeota archaeon]